MVYQHTTVPNTAKAECENILLLQGEPGAAGVSGLPGLPGEDGAPGQKVQQCLPKHFNTGY